MEGNEIEKAAEEYKEIARPIAEKYLSNWRIGDEGSQILSAALTDCVKAGANWQKERENKQLRTEIYVRDSLTAELTHFKGGYNAALDTIQQLQAELTRANARIEELSQWKETQIKLWLPVIEFMQENSNMKWGGSISEEVLKRLKETNDLYSKANGQ